MVWEKLSKKFLYNQPLHLNNQKVGGLRFGGKLFHFSRKRISNVK